jgi:hypothetical protein
MDDNRHARLVKAIQDLPEREKLVMGMHYEQELNLREIARYWVSANRACANAQPGGDADEDAAGKGAFFERRVEGVSREFRNPEVWRNPC